MYNLQSFFFNTKISLIEKIMCDISVKKPGLTTDS